MFKNKTKLRNVAVIAACLAVITMISSCNKEEEKVVDIKLLDTETSGPFSMRKFIYDDRNRMKEIQTFSGKQLLYKTILTYTGEELTKYEDIYCDEDGKELEGVDIRYFIKKGNTITWSTGVVLVDEEEEKIEQKTSFQSTFTLKNDGFPEKLEQEIFGCYSNVYFTFVNGNLTRTSYVNNLSGDDHLATGEGYCTYGAQRSALSGCNTPKWFLFFYFYENASHNVLIKAESKSIDAKGIKMEGSATFEYVFDHDGFPTKCTETLNNEYESITEYTYKN